MRQERSRSGSFAPPRSARDRVLDRGSSSIKEAKARLAGGAIAAAMAKKTPPVSEAYRRENERVKASKNGQETARAVRYPARFLMFFCLPSRASET